MLDIVKYRIRRIFSSLSVVVAWWSATAWLSGGGMMAAPAWWTDGRDHLSLPDNPTRLS
jgi:hypothetical protein